MVQGYCKLCRLFFLTRGFEHILNMMSIVLRVEYRLDVASNFSPWKEIITLILEVNDLLNFAKTTVTPPTNATLLLEHNKKDAKARMLILDEVRYHILPHLSGNKIAK